MGASHWDITVPYDDDIRRAFQRARALAFETGGYVGAERRPKTIEEAIEAEGADGTHSILDIERVEPDRGQPTIDAAQQLRIALGLEKGEFEVAIAYCVNAASRIALFGAEKPKREDFERGRRALIDSIGRGCAAFVVVYDEDAAPLEITFVGVTGD